MREEQYIDSASHCQQLEDNTQETIIFRSRNHRKQSHPCDPYTSHWKHLPDWFCGQGSRSARDCPDFSTWKPCAPDSPPSWANWDGCSLPQRRDSNNDLHGESRGQRPGRPRGLGIMEQRNWEQGAMKRSLQKFAENPLQSLTDSSLCLCVDLFKLLATRVERHLCKHAAFGGDHRTGHTLESRPMSSESPNSPWKSSPTSLKRTKKCVLGQRKASGSIRPLLYLPEVCVTSNA